MLVVAGLALVGAMLQQETPKDTAKKAADSAAVHRLQSITVRESARRAHRYGAAYSSSATKTDTPLRDTPQSVSVITKSLIAEQSMQSMTDALRYVPGVTMGQGEGHRDAPTIRGQSTTADFFVDGVRDDAQYYRDLYNVERVELLGGSNAMIFGRGGGGGVVNRVLKKAQWEPTRDLVLEGGSFAHTRGTLDVGGALTPSIASRVTSMSEHSGTFRNAGAMSRAGVNPSAAFLLGERTLARVGGEYFEDHRVVDRGVPSFRGLPSPAPLATFFGNPDSSRATLKLRGFDAAIDHQLGERATWKTQARVTSYDKFYQNVFPGAMDSTGTRVNLSAYSNMHDRTNVFAQTELVARYGIALPQTFVVGVEVGRQATDNLRRTGFFNGTTSSISVPFDTPTVSTPVAFRPNATDADNHVLATVGAVYAQDQLALSRRLQATLGVRAERFDIDFDNHRVAEKLQRTDDVISPRVGLVYKPVEPVSLYSSLSVSYLPSAGDQFSSLTATSRTLEPERFTNREVGLKWDVTPMLSLTTAAYRLDRTNTAAPDPVNPAVTVQTGRQRSTGVELTLNGRVVEAWDVVGTFTSQTATIVNRTSAAAAGASVPLVPRRRLSLWNRLQLRRDVGLGFGAVHQGDMFAAIDNSVTLPGFWRFDGAAYLTRYAGVTVQVNVENLFDRRYYATSQGNNNIMPGAPRTLRVSLATQLGQ
jgi:catecholate siderophore receptor